MTETAPQYFQARISEIIENVRNPKWRNRTYTFYRNTDPETERRTDLPKLHPDLDWVRIDEDGEIYISSWRQTRKIPPGPRVFGQTQRGRDYHLNPPRTKILEKLGFDHITGGIDVALRRTMEIRDSYRLEETPPQSEAGQMLATLERLGDLRRHLLSFPDLSDEELASLAEENLGFLATHGYLEPRLKEKLSVQRNLAKGFTDITGRKNILAAHTRMFAIELAVRKRLEVAFPAILAKYATMAELLSFQRESIRMLMASSVIDLEGILAQPTFAEDDQIRDTRPPIGEIYSVVWPTDGVCSRLARGVKVKPYIATVREVALDLGATNFSRGTKLGELQSKRRREGVPTAMDYFYQGRFSFAKGIIATGINSLRESLDQLNQA